MAVKQEHLEVDSAAARCRPIELITDNGFSIVRADEIDGRTPLGSGKHAFVVRDEHGHQLEITVEIDEKIFVQITLRSRGRITNQSIYWVCCAERHLADYLWENNRCPPHERLRVECLTPRDINLAIRWKTT
jgi:hypothetical protein